MSPAVLNPNNKIPRCLWLLWLGSLALLAAQPLRAEVVTWLYQVEVPVADQSEALRSDAARVALRTVLTRISGVAELPQDPVLAAAERNPGRYYTSFQYLSGASDKALAVRFAFDAALTLRLSKALELPVWWQNRPRVVPWLAVDEAQLVMAVDTDALQPDAAAERTGDGAVPPLGPGLKEAGAPRSVTREPGVMDPPDPAFTLAAAMAGRARERGLPLTLPTPDINGLEPLAPQRVALADMLELQAASTGLAAEWLGQGRIEQRAGTWFGALRFEPVNAPSATAVTIEPAASVADEITFNVQADAIADLGVQIVDRLSDALALRLAASGGGALTLRVQGVSGAQSLVDLLRYLRGLSFLDSVQIVESSQEGLLLLLDSQAEFEQLKRLLAVDAKLLPEPTEDVVAVFGPPVFRWQG